MSVADKDNRVGTWEIVGRTAAATASAYAVCYALAFALTAVLFRLSVGRADAVMIASVVALFVFPAISIWAFAERRLAVVLLAPVLACAVLALIGQALRP